jgi:hypothetical protein
MDVLRPSFDRNSTSCTSEVVFSSASYGLCSSTAVCVSDDEEVPMYMYINIHVYLFFHVHEYVNIYMYEYM